MQFMYFVLRVRCRRKESSRSLSHLLMSFLSLFNHQTITARVLSIGHYVCLQQIRLYKSKIVTHGVTCSSHRQMVIRFLDRRTSLRAKFQESRHSHKSGRSVIYCCCYTASVEHSTFPSAPYSKRIAR